MCCRTEQNIAWRARLSLNSIDQQQKAVKFIDSPGFESYTYETSSI